jgi:CHASE2 domain-containing sensor protein
MYKNPIFAAVFATVYLLVYVVFLQLDFLPTVTAVLFFFSPVVLVWLAYTVIRHGKFTGADLKEDEEWGYQDWS